MRVPRDESSREPLLSTADVAKWFGVSARTVCLWAECREIPAVKVGRQWRFREQDLARWLESAQARAARGRGLTASVAGH